MPPRLLLANRYRADVPLGEYLVSEKLDGVRGYWDGHKLLTRGGETVGAPEWFTAGWPSVPLDGELWAGRGKFEYASATVRQQTADDAAWRNMHYRVFDLPAHGGSFGERLTALQEVVARIDRPWVQAVEQHTVADRAALMMLLAKVVKAGGEGLMLHRTASFYRGERSDDLLKLKLHDDAEARVIGYVPGRGKYSGMLGALEVETAEGLRFRLGSGLSDARRRQPPPLGSWVTYRFDGVNPKTGIPRFAHFVRVRDDLSLP
jgi:DNA ligase